MRVFRRVECSDTQRRMQYDRVTKAAFLEHQVTHIHLLRHGAVDTGGHRRAYGHTDAPLSAEGQRQSADLIRFVQQNLPRPDGILCSDLQRCTAIAHPLGEALGVPVQTLPVLREQNMGQWEWKTWASLTLEDEHRVRAYWENYLLTAPPDGESFQQLALRAKGWWNDALPALAGRRWVVVGHIGIIRALLCQWFSHPLDQALRWAPKPGTHTHVLMAQTGPVLQVFGERTGAGSASGDVVHRARPVPQERPPRLALSGSAGVGKTSLGNRLSAEFGVPYIPEGMRKRLENGLNLHDLTHRQLQELVVVLWEEQKAAEQAAMDQHGGFISDRSAVDFAAFWLYYHFVEDEAASERFFADTLGWFANYDRVVLLPWGVLPLQADGVRSSNPWVQRHYQAVLEGLLSREVHDDRVLRLPELVSLEARVDWVRSALKSR